MGRSQPHRPGRAQPTRHGVPVRPTKPSWCAHEAAAAERKARPQRRRPPACVVRRAAAEAARPRAIQPARAPGDRRRHARPVFGRVARPRVRPAGRAQQVLPGAGRCALPARNPDPHLARHDHRPQRRTARGVHAGRIDLGQPAGYCSSHPQRMPQLAEGARRAGRPSRAQALAARRRRSSCTCSAG